ncbi:MAG: ABC transporter permease [Microthrixaceae bacterium]
MTVTEAVAPAEPAPTPSGSNRDNAVHGWPRLLALLIRRDRIRILIWAVAIGALVIVSASSIENLYSTPEQLATYSALAVDNAAIIIQAGPGYGLDEPTQGAVLMNELSLWTLMGVALMSIFMVTRHTRAEEENNTAELLRATPLGRYAAPVAAMVGVALTNVLVSIIVAAGLVLMGYAAAGSIAFGCALSACGLVFAALTLVTGQIASSARAATGLAVAVLGISFVLRAVGDVGNGLLSWLSPLHWSQAIQAFVNNDWWVLAIPLVATVGLTWLTTVLAAHRDFGSGMLPDRAGRPAAPRSLSGAYGLALRLQRAAMFAWVTGVTLLGVFYGVITDEAEQMVVDNPELEEFFAQAGVGSITDSFLATAALMIGLLATGYAVSGVLKLRTEETAGRAEPLLATPTSRTRWATSHLCVAAGGLLMVLIGGGFGLGLGAGIVTDDSSRVAQMIGSCLAVAPAVAVVAAVAFLLCCALPKWALLAWAAMAFVVVVGLLGAVLNLPQWVMDVSPFAHIPPAPAAPVTAGPLIVLMAISVALVALGLFLLDRRDMHSS